MRVRVLVQPHGGVAKVSLQRLPQALQGHAVCTLLYQRVQLRQHALQSALSLQHAAQSLGEDDLTEVGVQLLQTQWRC